MTNKELKTTDSGPTGSEEKSKLKENLLELARKYLDADGEASIQVDIEDGAIEKAQITILEAIDKNWLGRFINDEEARKAYEKLGIDPEKAADIRQRSGKWD